MLSHLSQAEIFLYLEITADCDCIVGSHSDGWFRCLVVGFWWKKEMKRDTET